jgi:16S rRNA (guanine966-N2)-methyltransferase
MNEVRIIGGTLRGRKIHFPSVAGLRPTLDRIRETLFNWLMFKIQDASCLDAFAGSGVLGFEALSRGAAKVSLIEQNHVAVLELKRNQVLLNLNGRAQVIEAAALDILAKAPMQSYDLIFLDPPFEQNLLAEALCLIAAKQLLKPEGLVYFEAEKRLDLPLAETWQIHRHKKIGDVQFGLLQIF